MTHLPSGGMMATKALLEEKRLDISEDFPRDMMAVGIEVDNMLL